MTQRSDNLSLKITEPHSNTCTSRSVKEGPSKLPLYTDFDDGDHFTWTRWSATCDDWWFALRNSMTKSFARLPNSWRLQEGCFSLILLRRCHKLQAMVQNNATRKWEPFCITASSKSIKDWYGFWNKGAKLKSDFHTNWAWSHSQRLCSNVSWCSSQN